MNDEPIQKFHLTCSMHRPMGSRWLLVVVRVDVQHGSMRAIIFNPKISKFDLLFFEEKFVFNLLNSKTKIEIDFIQTKFRK